LSIPADAGDGFCRGLFLDRVAQHHSYATGGHGKDEYFGEADKLGDRGMPDAETCNVYICSRMTRRLFAFVPTSSTPIFTSGPLQPYPGFDGPGGRDALATVNVDAGCSTSIKICFGSFTAASDRAWKATRCTATGL